MSGSVDGQRTDASPTGARNGRIRRGAAARNVPPRARAVAVASVRQLEGSYGPAARPFRAPGRAAVGPEELDPWRARRTENGLSSSARLSQRLGASHEAEAIQPGRSGL